jgi:hypothetical protein
MKFSEWNKEKLEEEYGKQSLLFLNTTFPKKGKEELKNEKNTNF